MPSNHIIMIQTKDNRKYFTEYKNINTMYNFAETFDAKLYLIESNDIKTMDIEQLARAICNESHRQPTYSKINIIKEITGNSCNRSSRIKNARLIRDFIRDKLQNGEIIKVRDLKRKFNDLHLSESCISNHVASVRREMIRSGFDVIRIKAGSYKLT